MISSMHVRSLDIKLKSLERENTRISCRLPSRLFYLTF